MTKEEFYSRALSFDEVGEQVDIFEKEKIKYEQEIERLNNIINELERYINEEYIYDELGMKIFDASKLQDKLQELKGNQELKKENKQLKEQCLNKIYLVIYIKSKKKQIIKYFETEYEKDKYKRRLPFIPDFILIEDSSDINWNYS